MMGTDIENTFGILTHEQFEDIKAYNRMLWRSNRVAILEEMSTTFTVDGNLHWLSNKLFRDKEEVVFHAA